MPSISTSYGVFTSGAAFTEQELSCCAGIFLSDQNNLFFMMRADLYFIREMVTEGRMRGKHFSVDSAEEIKRRIDSFTTDPPDEMNFYLS